MKKITIVGTAFIIFLLTACNESPKKELDHNEEHTTTGEGSHAEEGGHKEEEGVVEISKEQAETIGLEVGLIKKRSIGNNIKVTGILELFPQDRATVSPFVGGNINSIKVIEGDRVRKGEVLAYLQHPDIISMQQELQEKNDELIFLEQDFERKKILYDKGVSSGKEFQMAQSKFRSTTSSVNGLRSKLRLLGLDVSKVVDGEIYSSIPMISPINGFVDDVMISIGDYVAPQSKMFAISDNSKIHLDLKIYEKDINKVREGQQIYFTVASKPNEILEAKVHSIGKTFETNPKALHVHADIDNKGRHLLPGMYVEGRIVQGKKMVFAVPEEAIIKDAGRAFIFVLDNSDTDDGMMKYKMVTVSTGLEDLGFVEISLREKLKKDTKVVTKGAYVLSSEMIKGELRHDH